MTIGFIGLGHMGLPMLTRLLDAGNEVIAYDTQVEALGRAEALGARPASSPKDVADRAATVLASLPSPQVSAAVAVGPDGLVHGAAIHRFLDMSTTGAGSAQRIAAQLAGRGIAMLDCPVSGGVGGATAGTLAIMVSGPKNEFACVSEILHILGRPYFVDAKAGAGQTMKLVNNFISAATLAATAEAMVMGVKAGLDPTVMIDVLNAGSGSTHASRDKFPKAVLPRTFDYGFATGLMTKDVRLYLAEAADLGVPADLAGAVAQLWAVTIETEGADSDFTSIVKPMETAAGVIVAGREPHQQSSVSATAPRRT